MATGRSAGPALRAGPGLPRVATTAGHCAPSRAALDRRLPLSGADRGQEGAGDRAEVRARPPRAAAAALRAGPRLRVFPGGLGPWAGAVTLERKRPRSDGARTGSLRPAAPFSGPGRRPRGSPEPVRSARGRRRRTRPPSPTCVDPKTAGSGPHLTPPPPPMQPAAAKAPRCFRRDWGRGRRWGRGLGRGPDGAERACPYGSGRPRAHSRTRAEPAPQIKRRHFPGSPAPSSASPSDFPLSGPKWPFIVTCQNGAAASWRGGAPVPGRRAQARGGPDPTPRPRRVSLPALPPPASGRAPG